MPQTPSADQLIDLCRVIGAEIHDLAAAQGAGRMNEQEFVDTLLRLEVERAAPHGLTLTASHTFDYWTVVSLRVPGHSEPCASYEFQPATGQFRHVGTLCRNHPAALGS